MKKSISVLLILAMTCTLLAGCGLIEPVTDEDLIRERIDTFCTCYNNGDLDGAIDCLCAKSRNTAKASLKLAEGIGKALLGDLDLPDLGLSMSDMFGLGVGVMGEDDLLVIRITEIRISGDTAVVTGVLDMNYDFEVGEDHVKGPTGESVTIQMVKEDGDWYIKE
jgi:hypothetical protein